MPADLFVVLEENMEIKLGKAQMWSLPSDRKGEKVLTTSNPGPIEIDYDNLSDSDKKVINASLALKTILNASEKVERIKDLDSETTRLSDLALSEFRTEVTLLVAYGNRKLLEKLLEVERNKEKHRNAVIRSALATLASKGDTKALEAMYEASIHEEPSKVLSKGELDMFLKQETLKLTKNKKKVKTTNALNT
mgnify:CR=1 FL=1